MNENSIRQELAAHPFPLVFATVSGAHLYGFPSPDSDYDLRGVHLLPLAQVVGLRKGPETVERSGVRNGMEMDLVSQELHKFIRLMLKRNGHVLEYLYSPLVIHSSPEHKELLELGKGCVTRHHIDHYLGFAEKQWKLFRKEKPPRVKPLLYVFRVLLTGIHLMRTGEVLSNLSILNQEFRLGFIDDMLDFKLAGEEKGRLDEPRLDLMEKEYRRMLGTLEIEGERSSLPPEPSSAGGLHDLLVRVRLGQAR